MVQAQRPVQEEPRASMFASAPRDGRSGTSLGVRETELLDEAKEQPFAAAGGSPTGGLCFTCEQAKLSQQLATVGRAIASRPALPILANVLVEASAERQQVALTGFDLSLGIRSEFEAEVKASGCLTLPAKLFGDIVSRLPSGSVTVSQVQERVILTSAAGQYQLRSAAAEEYPTLPEVVIPAAIEGGAARALEVPIESLLQGIGQTLFAASSDETKQVLTGVHVKLVPGEPPQLEFAATDGHRLAIAQVEVEGIPVEVAREGRGPDFTIPARTLREVERILSAQTGASKVELRFDQSQVQFVLPQQRITSRLLEGQYPDYNRLLPRQFERQVTLERRPLMESLERVGVFAAQRNDIIKFSLSAATQTLRISTEAPDVGSGEESLPVQMSGPDLEVAFNVRYLLEALKVFHTQQVSLELNGATQPAVWKPLGAVRLCYLVMPVQLRAT